MAIISERRRPGAPEPDRAAKPLPNEREYHAPPGRWRGGTAWRSGFAALAFSASLVVHPLSGKAAEQDQPHLIGPDSPDAIIVTARRQAEPAIAVPISLTALDAPMLDHMGADTISDIARAVPNLTLSPNGVMGIATPSIRGIFSATGGSTVGLYIDDVPVQIRSVLFSRNVDLRVFDLDRVEVLRGPQGSLFGASSMGGTIRFISRQPATDRFSTDVGARVMATQGGGVGHQLQAAFGGPITPGRLGVRAALYHRSDAGYVDRIDRATGTISQRDIDRHSVSALRGALRIAPGNGVAITPAVFYQRGRRNDYSFFDDRYGPYRQGARYRQPSTDRFILPSLTAEVDLGGVTLTSVTAWFDRDDRQTTDYSSIFGELVLGGTVPGLEPDEGTFSRTHIGQRGTTQEIRLASPKSDTAPGWVLGAYYGRSRLRLAQDIVDPGLASLVSQYFGTSVEGAFGTPLLPGNRSYHGTEKTVETEIAAFADVNWKLAPRLEVSAGVRVSRTMLDLSVLSQGPYAGGNISLPGERSSRETPVTPRFGVAYRPDSSQLYYLNVGKGYRIGGANPPVPVDVCAADLRGFGRDEAPAAFASDSLWSYEIGLKKQFTRPRLTVSAALFQIDWSNIQQPVTLPNCGFSFTDNLGTARNRGFEAELEAKPVAGLTLYAGLGFIDARFRKTIAADAGDMSAIIAARGDRLPYVPRWSGQMAIEYRTLLSPKFLGHLRAQYAFATPYRRAPSPESQSYDARVYRGEDYGNLALRAGIDWRNWQISAYIDNLLNDRSILYSSSDLAPVSGVPLKQMALRPRTVGLAATLRY